MLIDERKAQVTAILPPVMKTLPAVFAVEDEYQIMVPVNADALMWVEVAGEVYPDAAQGTMRSHTDMHRMRVPMNVLDAAGEYTVVYRKIIDRKPYFAESEEPVRLTLKFQPLTKDMKEIRAYHIADAHSHIDAVVSAALYYGESPDLLIMNGDLPNHSGCLEYFDNIYIMAQLITLGERPIVFARGNHDCRGFFAEEIGRYIPLSGDNSFYTFRVGPVWGMVLDCGEDKTDDHAEYGHPVNFHFFRLQEDAFIRKVLAEKPYAADGIDYRIVVVHVPVMEYRPEPFNIEEPLFDGWTQMMDQMGIDLMFCGHNHELKFHPAHDPAHRTQVNFPVLVASLPIFEDDDDSVPEHCYYAAAAVQFSKEYDGKFRYQFTDSEGKVRGEGREKE